LWLVIAISSFELDSDWLKSKTRRPLLSAIRVIFGSVFLAVKDDFGTAKLKRL
jgi:hypothetical protein